MPDTTSAYDGLAYCWEICLITLRVASMVSPVVQPGVEVRWPELSYPFCERGAPGPSHQSEVLRDSQRNGLTMKVNPDL